MEHNLSPIIQVDPEKCTGCHRCIMVCPTKMCNDGDGDHVNVNHDLCIGCGECLDACEHDARYFIDDSEAFFKALKGGAEVVAIVAPAVAANFPNQYLNLNGWLKELGVRAVFDVSFGAELTVKSYLEYAKKHNPKKIIAQPCPALVSFIEIYRPELIPYLAPADSPMVHTMKMVREFYPDYKEAQFAVISPCLAKRREFDEVGIGEYNVTMKSIQSHLEEKKIRLDQYPAEDYDNPPAERAVLFSTPGGLMQTVQRESEAIARKTRKIEGPHSVYHYFAHLAQEIESKDEPLYTLIDCLNCELGCNAGPGTNNRGKHPDAVEYAVQKRGEAMIARYAPKGPFARWRSSPKRQRRKINRLLKKYWKEGLYTRTYVDRSDYLGKYITKPTEEQLQEVYQLTHKNKPEDFLNCSSCGYNSCEQMAVAIINGLNKAENCRQYAEVELQNLHEEHKLEVSEAIQSVSQRSAEYLQNILSSVENLAHMEEAMSSSVMQSSTAIEEMVAQINSIEEFLKQNAVTVQKLQEASQQGKEGLSSVVSTIKSISDNSDALFEASSVIQNIADQTNLLSMNASIEAAHAGDFGRGFSVVANEIRKLAEHSASETKSISEVLKNVRGYIDTVQKAADETEVRFDSVTGLSQTVQNQEEGIKNAVEEQSSGGKEVLESLSHMKNQMEDVQKQSQEILESTQNVHKDIKSLAEM